MRERKVARKEKEGKTTKKLSISIWFSGICFRKQIQVRRGYEARRKTGSKKGRKKGKALLYSVPFNTAHTPLPFSIKCAP